MKNSNKCFLVKRLKKRKKQEIFPSNFPIDLNDYSTKSLMCPEVSLKDQKSYSERKKIENFQELITGCDDLIKDVSCLTSDIKKSLKDKKKKKSKQTEPEPEIRNTFYFSGLKRIEEKIQSERNKNKKNELKNLKTLVEPSISYCIENFITAEDLTSQAGIEFLAENKREFGGKLVKMLESPVKESCKKGNLSNKRISAIEFDDKDAGRIKKHRYSVPSLLIEKNEASKPCRHLLPVLECKRKLPILDLATINTIRAKNEANRFFADNKMITSRLNKRKGTLPSYL